MKYEMSQKKIYTGGGSFFGMFPLIILIFFLLTSIQTYGQTVKSKSQQNKKNLRYKFQLSEAQLSRLRPLIQKQIMCLEKIFTRYTKKIDADYIAFWTDMDVWLELKDDRNNFAANLNTILTKEQAQALQRARFDLENTNLSLLLDEQMSILDEELDLDEGQDIDIQKVLTQDIRKKRGLIGSPSPSDDSFLRKLKAISDETENKIKKILFPDQNRTYQKNKQNSQKNGSGLWG